MLDGDNLAVIQILNLSGVQGFTACVIFLFKRKQHAADNAEKGEAEQLSRKAQADNCNHKGSDGRQPEYQQIEGAEQHVGACEHDSDNEPEKI